MFPSVFKNTTKTLLLRVWKGAETIIVDVAQPK